MKTICVILMVMSVTFVKAQTPDNKIVKEIKGVIESDGHIMNDSVKFFINVDLDGFKIKGSNGKFYTNRKCYNKKCKIIHLENKRNQYNGKYYTI